MYMDNEYAIEMLNITKVFPGIVANDDITIKLRKGEIHALLGENGAGKSTLMSVLFGLYQPEKGEIRKNGERVYIKNPNDANKLGIGMVHQHFKLVECFTVLENIILGVEPQRLGFIQKKNAKKKVAELSERYGLKIDINARVEDISVGMQQRVEILKMLYRENEILIFDEPTAVLTPQEISELIKIMRNLTAEGKSILFITHKLNEIMETADRCSVLRKGKYVGTVNVNEVTKEKLTSMMVGRNVQFNVDKKPVKCGDAVLQVENMVMASRYHKMNAVKGVSFSVYAGETVCIAGIDGNGQSELIYGLTGIDKPSGGKILLNGMDISKANIRKRSVAGMSCIPEDRHKYGLVLDFPLEDNLILHEYYKEPFNKKGFIDRQAERKYADNLIEKFDVRSGQGAATPARSMSGGNQQKAIIAREISKDDDLLIAVHPTRGLDVAAIEYIHNQIINQRNNGKAVLLVSFELDEVLDLADRILVMFQGEIVGELDPQKTTAEELGLYMAGAKRDTPLNEERSGNYA